MLQEAIKHLKDVCRKEGLDVSPNTILEMAVKIMISNNIDKSKKENIQSYQKTKINDSGAIGKAQDNDKATPKQIVTLKRMGEYFEGIKRSLEKD